MKSIVKNVAIITFFSVLTRLFGFVFRIFLSRTIGAEALGMYQVVLSVFMVFLTIVSSGFTLIISRMTASYRVKSDKKAIASLVSSCAIVGLVVSVLLCFFIFVFKNVFSHIFTDANCVNILIILLPSLVFSAVYSVFRGAMWGQDNYFGLCVSELIEQISKILICVLILGSGMSAIESAMGVACSFTFSCLISAVFVTVLYFVYGGRLARPTKVYRNVVKQSAPITGVRVLGSFAQPLIALILPARLVDAGFTSSQAMSIFGVAIGMTLPLLYLPSTLVGSLATALVPDISMALAKKDKQHIQKRMQTSVNFTTLVSFLIAPIFIAVGDKIGVFLYNDALSGTLLQFSAWLMVPMGLTNISSAMLNSLGYEVKSFVNYVIGGIFMFLSILILPKYIGVNSLIVGMGISTVVTASLNFLMLRRKLDLKIDVLPKVALLILLCLPTIALTSFLSGILSNFLPLFFDLLISCSVGLVVFVLLCTVFGMIKVSTLSIVIKKRLFAREKNI